MLIAFFVLFVVFAFGSIPLFIKLFVLLATRVGLGAHPVVKKLTGHFWAAVWAFWILYAAGLAIALPTMIRDGFFSGTL